MLQFKSLLGLLVMVCLFASCEKNNVWEQQEVQSVVTIPMNNSQEAFMAFPPTTPPKIPIFHEILSYTGECVSGLGFCYNPFPFPPNDFLFEVLSQENVGLANTYIDENSAFILEIDASTLGDVFANEITNAPMFNVSNDVVLPVDLVKQTYESSGLTAPSENLVIPSGDYVVDVEEGEAAGIIVVTVIIVTEEAVIVIRIVYN